MTDKSNPDMIWIQNDEKARYTSLRETFYHNARPVLKSRKKQTYKNSPSLSNADYTGWLWNE